MKISYNISVVAMKILSDAHTHTRKEKKANDEQGEGGIQVLLEPEAPHGRSKRRTHNNR